MQNSSRVRLVLGDDELYAWLPIWPSCHIELQRFTYNCQERKYNESLANHREQLVLETLYQVVNCLGIDLDVVVDCLDASYCSSPRSNSEMRPPDNEHQFRMRESQIQSSP